MKVRESGMTNECEWMSFLNAADVLKKIGLSNKIEDEADFGCGYETFTIMADKIVSGIVYAIDPKMITAVKSHEKIEEASS